MPSSLNNILLFLIGFLIGSPYNSFQLYPVFVCGLTILVMMIYLRSLSVLKYSVNNYAATVAATFFIISFISYSSQTLISGVSAGFFWWLMLALLCILPVRWSLSIKIASGMFIGSFACFCTDLYYRMVLGGFSSDNFYTMKFGVVGDDSNFLAVYLVFGMLPYLMYKINTKLKIPLVSLFFSSLLLTLSRASIVAVVLISLKALKLRNYHWFGVICISSYLFFYYIINDDSFRSKFDIFFDSYNSIQSIDFENLLFGLGGNRVIGEYSLHLILLQIFFIGGASLLCAFFAQFLFFKFKKLKGCLMLFEYYFIAGLSFMVFSHPIITYSLFLMLQNDICQKSGNDSC